LFDPPGVASIKKAVHLGDLNLFLDILLFDAAEKTLAGADAINVGDYPLLLPFAYFNLFDCLLTFRTLFLALPSRNVLTFYQIFFRLSRKSQRRY
jgi:hypothetical protein